MACPPTPCPPSSAPDPQAIPTWTIPSPFDCGRGQTYYNSPQTYVNSCPAGSPTPPISVTIPAFTYSSTVSQEAADDTAMAAAETEANAERVSHPCQSAESDFLITEDSDFLVTEDGSFLTT